MRDVSSELYKRPPVYVSSLSSDDAEDQMLVIHEDDGTTTAGPPEAQLAQEARPDMSSKDINQEAELDTARAPLHTSELGTNGLLRHLPVFENLPPLRRQKASGQPEDLRHSSGNQMGDVAYNSIPDYAPPTSTLPTGNPRILQVQWRQEALVDLSSDPDRHMLHDAEVELAKTLNLSCAKYLCTKRRIFQARVKALQEGREFRKYESQKACKIDTNKASKLCGVFEKVGWFDKKYFLRYLDESNDPLSRPNNESKDRGSSSSGLTELDIWGISDSEFHFTSEGDEESTDGSTADSSVSFGGRHDGTEGRKRLDSCSEPLLKKQCYGLSLVGGDRSQREVRNDTPVQTYSTLSRNEYLDECPMTEGRSPRQGLVLKETVYPRKPAGFSADDTEECLLLETRSMTQKIKLAQSSHHEDRSACFSNTIEAKNSQQKSSLERPHRLAAPTDQSATRKPLPRSLDEASAADIMLIKMKEECRPWPEIKEAWEKKTGKAQNTKSLSSRYTRVMANLTSLRLRADEKPNKVYSVTYPHSESHDVSDDSSINNSELSSLKQDQLLLSAEAEIEENFQREKAYILAEIESNFQSEKWNLVAEAMSRTGSATYSAKSIQAQYERLIKKPKGTVVREDENNDISTDLAQRTPRAVGMGKPETSTPSRSGAGRLDEASNPISSPADEADRGHRTVRKCGPQNHAEHSARMRRVWAKRKALGTNGHHGGPPKASTLAKAKKVVPVNTPSAGNSLAPVAIHQSVHAKDLLPSHTRPIVLEGKAGRDANQHQQSLAQIVPAAALVASGKKHNQPPRKVSMY